MNTNECFRVQDAVRDLYALCEETGTELLHVDAVMKVLEDLRPVQAGSWMLTGIRQDERGSVSAGTPGSFGTEEEAAATAKRRLAEDFGISLDDVEELAQEGGTPYVLSLAKDGVFEAFTISQVSVRPAGFIYEIRDKATGGLLMSAGIFRTEEDAREQARMEVALHNIKGCFIRTAPAAGLWPGWGV